MEACGRAVNGAPGRRWETRHGFPARGHGGRVLLSEERGAWREWLVAAGLYGGVIANAGTNYLLPFIVFLPWRPGWWRLASGRDGEEFAAAPRAHLPDLPF